MCLVGSPLSDRTSLRTKELLTTLDWPYESASADPPSSTRSASRRIFKGATQGAQKHTTHID